MKNGLITLLIAATGLGLTLASTGLVESPWGLVLCMAGIIAGVMGLAIRYRAERRLPLLSDPMFLACVFFAQFYVVGPISLPLFQWHMVIALPIELVLRTMAAFLVLLVCFVIGYQIRLGTLFADLIPSFDGGRMKLPGRVAETVVLAASIFGCAMYVDDQGGLAAALSRGYGQLKYSGFYQLPFHTLILGTFMMTWRMVDSPRTTWIDRIVYAGLLLAELPFYGLVLGSRNRLFFLFFGIYTIWGLRRGIGKWVHVSSAATLAILMVFFSIWGTIRSRPVGEMMQGGGPNPMYTHQAPYMGYFASVAEPFAVACLIQKFFPDSEPFRHGSTLLVTLYGFIPRAVWPDKPIGFAKEITRLTDGVFYTSVYGHTLTVTFLGDFWANAGWLGVIVGGLVFGVVSRTMAAYAAQGMVRGGIQTAPSRVLMAAIFAASLAEVRADTAVILAFWLMMMPWLILSVTFCRLDYSQQGAPFAQPELAGAPAELGAQPDA